MTSQVTGQLKAIVGDNLTRAKAEHDALTDREIAFAIDADPGQVAKWRRGDHMPSERHLLALAAFFKRDMSWFYEDRRKVAA